MSETILSLRGITKEYCMGDEVQQVLKGIDLDVAKGEFVAILGPSGSGKSTLMNIIGCLDTPTGGSYNLHGRDVESLDESDLARMRNKEIGFVFQSFQLLQRQDAMENVELPLIYSGMRTHERTQRAKQMLERVGLSDKLHHYPNQLSGGQQQRVAIARAMVKSPQLLLLDEPLSNLDARLRLQTREEIRRIQRQTGVTTVFVTHDQDEAMSISDMIVVMKDGVVQQIGAPQQVYDSPVNLFVARFLGTPPINVFSAHIAGEKVFVGNDIVAEVPGADDQNAVVALRPEGFILREGGSFGAHVERVEVMGRDVSLILSHPHSLSETLRCIVSAESIANLPLGEVRFELKKHKLFVYSEDGSRRIPTCAD